MILALDTSLGAVSACVLDAAGDAILASISLKMERGHAEAVIPALETLLRDVEGGLEGLTRVAVTVGPGSFTGIRVGVAAARGVALARGVDVVGISTLTAFAAPHLGAPGTVVVSALEARGGVLQAEICDDRGRRLFTGVCSTPSELLAHCGKHPLRLTGPAAPRLAVEAWSVGLLAEVAGETDCPDVVYVARLGLLTDPREAPPRPVYMSPEAKGGVPDGRIPV